MVELFPDSYPFSVILIAEEPHNFILEHLRAIRAHPACGTNLFSWTPRPLGRTSLPSGRIWVTISIGPAP
jgi:hypothetical protein